VKKTVQARLDEESYRSLRRLARRLGETPSEIVRRGIRLVESIHGGRGRLGVIGMGRFESGVKDLGSNKDHLKGFGQ